MRLDFLFTPNVVKKIKRRFNALYFEFSEVRENIRESQVSIFIRYKVSTFFI